jgi:ABC-2 type transport system permease protein
MVMSLPFKVSTVVTNRFLLMYVKDLPFNMLISASALAGYAIVVKPALWVYPAWMILSLFVVIIPMIIAAFLGALLLRVTTTFKHKKLITIILTFILVIPCMFMNAIIQYVVRNDKVDEVMDKSLNTMNTMGRYTPGVSWFAKAINEGSIVSMLLLIVVSIVLYIVFFVLVSRSYRAINSRMSVTNAKHKKVTDKEYKERTVVGSIAFKELRTFTGCVTYVVNDGMGVVMAFLAGIACLVFNLNKFLSGLTDVPFELMRMVPCVTLIIYFFVGMMPTTTASPSLEGKNYWIVKSLPIDMLTVYKGKMRFNNLLSIPVGVFAVVCMCFSLRLPLIDYVVNICLIVSSVLFSTVYGMYCGARKLRLDWDHEIQVVKQGPGASLYVLTNMFPLMLIISALGGLALVMDTKLPALALSVIYLLFTLLSYKGVKKVAKNAH